MNTMIQSPLRSLWVLLIVSTFISGCTSDVSTAEEQAFSITARIPAEPDKLNPLITFQAYSRVVNEQIFQYLLQFDPETLELVPQLATQRAEYKELEDGSYAGGVAYTFEIRPEAKWDDGKPITAEDVAFSLKTLFHPEISPSAIRSYFDSFRDIEIDPDNPRKFTIYSNKKYMLAEAALGGIAVLPEHLYDKDGVMKKYTLADLADETKALELVATNEELVDYAADFTSTERSHDPALISGSGPYRLVEWQTEQFLRLEKKENWWGNKVANKNRTLTAYPQELIYKIIKDQTSAVNALQSGEIDVAAQIDSRAFKLLQEDTSFTNRYKLATPLAFQIYYVGFNNRIAKLNDPKVRKALAHALDMDKVIENLFANFAERVSVPFHPKQAYYDKGLPLVDYNIQKSKKLLQEAGWEDTNSNGTLDKVINGRRTELSLNFLTSTSSKFGTDLALFYKESLQQIGVELLIDAKEFSVVRDNFRRQEFEVFAGGWAQEPLPDDPKQAWHSTSGAPGGYNRMGFGDAASDRLIDEIRKTINEDERNQLMKQFQKMLYDAQPGIFLFAAQERIAISKRFDGQATSVRPGFFLNDFQLMDAKR